MRLWQIGQTTGFKLELLDLDVGLEDVGNFGIEEQAQDVLLKGELDVVVVGTVDDHVQIDLDGLDSFIAISEEDDEGLFVEFLERGGEMHLGALVPLNQWPFTLI